jgi:hypothetical protein
MTGEGDRSLTIRCAHALPRRGFPLLAYLELS